MRAARQAPLHVGLRLESALHRLGTSVARKRGLRPGVLAYTGYGTTRWARVLGRVILTDPGRPAPPDVALPTWRRFLTLEQSGVEVVVEVGGERRTTVSDHGGYVDAVVPADLSPGWAQVRLRVAGEPPAVGRVRIVDPAEDFGIVSDIDDTVIVTMLPRPLLAAYNTLLVRGHARHPVPGMAQLYAELLAARPHAPVVYVSTGAWNTAAMLRRFLARTGFPEGPLLLTDWGPTPARWFRSGPGHKRAALRRLADDLPGVRWLLVGDDGQHDPELYAEFAAERPDHVRAVAIRQLTTTEAVLAHGAPTHPAPTGQGQAPVPTVAGSDGAALAARLREVGLLDDLCAR